MPENPIQRYLYDSQPEIIEEASGTKKKKRTPPQLDKVSIRLRLRRIQQEGPYEDLIKLRELERLLESLAENEKEKSIQILNFRVQSQFYLAQVVFYFFLFDMGLNPPLTANEYYLLALERVFNNLKGVLFIYAVCMVIKVLAYGSIREAKIRPPHDFFFRTTALKNLKSEADRIKLQILYLSSSFDSLVELLPPSHRSKQFNSFLKLLREFIKDRAAIERHPSVSNSTSVNEIAYRLSDEKKIAETTSSALSSEELLSGHSNQ